MTKMTVQIELNEQDIDKLIDEIDEEDDWAVTDNR